VGWDGFGDFVPAASALVHANEAFPVIYRITVSAGDGVAAQLTVPSRVLAHNEWQNSPALYDSLGAFVQPNTDSVNVVLRAAATLLDRETGSGSLEGYQVGPRRAAQIGAAIYEALREQRITYVGSLASFEDTGQKIRITAAVLRECLGNCIDLSATYAACLEAAGLHPLVWIVEGHAFAGFFLGEDQLPETVSLDPAQMTNVVEADKAVVVELTGIGPGENSLTFAEAAKLGKAHLRGPAALRGMVDIRLARRVRYPPHAAGRFATCLADDGAPARIVAWRRALLDLSLRNPLLKLPKRGKELDLHVPAGSLAVLDDLIHSGKAINVRLLRPEGHRPHPYQGPRDTPSSCLSRAGPVMPRSCTRWRGTWVMGGSQRTSRPSSTAW
jgi:hypothetical protein